MRRAISATQQGGWPRIDKPGVGYARLRQLKGSPNPARATGYRGARDLAPDTTRNQLAAAVQVFCEHPDQWALLAEHPELAHKAVEEAMRYSPVIFTGLRVAVEDVELADVRIPAATLVIANTSAANRDPAVYTDPDRFDITRENAPAMLTFGGGIHYCLGSHLARIELAEALTTMARHVDPT
jgi:cytochrome P450